MTNLDFLGRLDATAQAELVRRGELTAADLLEACARRIDAMNPLVHAVVTTGIPRCRERARAGVSGPFAGVPLLVKDLTAYPGMRCSFGARLFAKNVAGEGSPFTARLDEAGFLAVGKSATSELGLLGSTETLAEGITHNPWDLSRSASGSSGGAAAAVAAGIVPIAHASDGGGSIRIPASVCGLFGLKPSRGRIVSASAARSAFDELVAELCVSRSVRDTAHFLALVEATSDSAPFRPVGFVREASPRRLRIGAWSTTLVGGEPEPEVRAALDAAIALCARLGHQVEVIPPPRIDGVALSDAFFTTAAASLAPMADMMAQMLGRPIGADDLEPFTRALIDDYRGRPAGAPERARAVFADGARAYRDATAAFDVILTPTLATVPWRLGELAPTRDRETLLRATERAVGYTPIHNVAGAPGMSVPLHWTSAGLPIGVHFAAPPGEEARLLALAYELEEAQPWGDRWARLVPRALSLLMPQVLKDDVRERILAAALQVFASLGYTGATMGVIAARCQLAAGSLYRYYPSKQGLFDAVVPFELARELEEHLERAVRSLAHAPKAVGPEYSAEGEALLRFWMDHRLAVVILLDRAAGTPYGDYGERFVSRLVSLSIDQIRADYPGVRINAVTREVLTHVFEGTRRTIAAILDSTEDEGSIRDAIAAFRSYQIPGLRGLAAWTAKGRPAG